MQLKLNLSSLTLLLKNTTIQRQLHAKILLHLIGRWRASLTGQLITRSLRLIYKQRHSPLGSWSWCSRDLHINLSESPLPLHLSERTHRYSELRITVFVIVSGFVLYVYTCVLLCLTQFMRTYLGRPELGSCTRQKAYITFPLFSSSTISSNPPSMHTRTQRIRWFQTNLVLRTATAFFS